MKLSKYLSLLLIFSIVWGCTPKTAQEITKPDKPKPVAPPKIDEELSPCAKFSDAPSPEDAETNYVLYRDFLRTNEIPTAFNYWQKVYKNANDMREPNFKCFSGFPTCIFYIKR